MTYTKFRITAAGLFMFIALSSGIGRHDVDPAAYRNLAAQKPFECVGRVYKDSVATASCVLISERYVLTAAHALLVSDLRKDTVQLNGQTFILYVPENTRVAYPSSIYITVNGQQRQIKSMTLHPGYLKNTNKGYCDLALLELHEPINTVAAARLYIKDDEMSMFVTGVGYGVTGKADKMDSVAQTDYKTAGNNVVDKISGPKSEGRKTILSCDFDAPGIAGCNKMGMASPLPLEYICGGGDSGGGLFKEESDGFYLVGICSGSGTDINQMLKTGYYGQVMDWTRVSAFAKWIHANMKG